jgi:hypothetical protein
MVWRKGNRRSGQKKSQRFPAVESLEVRSLLSAAQPPIFGPDGLAEHLPGEILVQYKPQAAAAGLQQARAVIQGTLLETIHTNVMQRQGMGVLERIQVGQGKSVVQALAALKNNPLVAYAEPNYIYRAAAVSNDPSYTSGNLWGMYSSDTPATAGPSGTTNQFGSAAEQAWNINITGSRNVVVGIIDEGIQNTHPDLINNIWVNPYEVAGDGVDNDGNGYIDDRHGWDFVNNDNTVYDAGQDAHGTHVAGTIGGEGGNANGVVGVNWSVTMISAKFLGTSGGSLSNAIRAVDYLTDLKTRHGINIVASNNSWGGGGYSQGLHDAIIRGAKQDILFVAAAGNSTTNNDATASYPSNYNTSVGTSTQTAASYDAVIAVASITSTGAISSFSSYGATTVDIGAPGSSIVSSVPVDAYANYSGTSMATPHVTGAVALYASTQSGRIAASAIRTAILSTAVPTASLSGKTATGGRLNVYEAIRKASYVDLEKTVYGPTQSALITLANSASNVDPNAAETVTVEVRSTTESTPLTITLTETGVSTGVFTGSVQLASGAAAADNLLQVAHNDTITARFVSLNLTDTATVDGVAPTLSGLSATPAGTTAVISFTTNEPSRSTIRYGTSPQSLNQTVSGSTLLTSHSVVLAGLTPGLAYYYDVTVTDAAANAFTSSVQSFTTAPPAPILFVDDDMGATYERFFTAALNANSLTFDSWNVAAAGATPSASSLAGYRAVIWNTGYDYSSTGAGLSSAEQSAISTYLNGGGRIFISGQDILYNGVTAAFQQTYLKIASFTQDVSTAAHTETGVAGNPITNAMSLAVAAPADFPSLYVDAVTPVTGASGLLQHGVVGAGSPFSGVSYRGDYAAGGFGVVFSTVPFESISSTAAAPNNQAEFLKRTMDFLLVAPPTGGIQVSSPSSSTTSEAGGQATFTVVLTTQPTANVTINLSSSDATEGSVSPASLVFTSANWNTPQTVTATGVNDLIDDGDVSWTVVIAAATSSDPAYNGLNPADVALSNTDDDTAGITVSAPSGTVTTEAAGAITFTMKLDSEPVANVTINLSSSDTTEGSVSPASLVFTPANWNTPQTVTATGVNDAIDDGDLAWTVVIAAANSSDSGYNGLNPADVVLSNADDDTAGITVSAPSGTVTTEAGGAVTFTVKLDSEPLADVTINLSSSDATEGSVSPASLVFTSANWNTPQTVTATGVNDAIDDGDIVWTAVIAAATSTDSGYNGLNPADVALTNTDDDTAGITVSAPSGTSTTEAGGSVTFTVQLDSEPLADVTISLSSSDATEGSVSPATLTFTPANWNTAQTVTATGLNDLVTDGDVVWTVVVAAASSSDTTYSGLDASDVQLVNIDNDAPGISVSTPSSSTTTEDGGTATFTVTLNTEPTADVTIAVSSGDATEGGVSTNLLTFTPANWNVPQTVTAAGVDDAIADGNISWTVILAAAVSTDPTYDGLNPADVELTNTDNDTAGISVSSPSGNVTTEAGGAVTFTVVLNSEPIDDVTIAVSSSDATEGSVSTSLLTFTPANWNVAQTVTATGVDDAVDDGSIVWSVVLANATSTDSNYNGLNPADVSLSNTDNDTAGITVSAPSGTVTTEAGGAITFTVTLNSQPLANVTVAISSSDTTEGSVSPASLTFTAANWNSPQTVTVTGVDDTIFDGSIAYVAVIGAAASSDGLYNGLNPADISLTNSDNDSPPPTKFYAVDDAAPDRTFEYAADGTLIEFYGISTSNSAPRGIATVTAGDRLWVVDASRNVFVYNNSGGLLGSWTAGSLANNATIEGIATNGTHIWIVDARADRVYYYANAASRLSGSQNATTNFALANGNAGPKDLVFGTQSGVNYLWVVNDAATDRVFRYTLNASGVATASSSWLINSANARPTGITLDPSNGSMDIWISDNSTDRVYRYANGRTLTAPALTSSFALAVASGNGNVQGIADPPPAAIESTLAGYQLEVAAEPTVSDIPAGNGSRSLITSRQDSTTTTLVTSNIQRGSGVRLNSGRRQSLPTATSASLQLSETTAAVSNERSSDLFQSTEDLDALFSDAVDISRLLLK